MGTQEQFTDLLKQVEILKADSAEEIRQLREENASLRKMIALPGPEKMPRRLTSTRYSRINMMADVVVMAQNTSALEGLVDHFGDDLNSSTHTQTNTFSSDGITTSDGMDLSKSATLDPSRSSYATGYDYSLLSARKILVTMHDVGHNNRDIDAGPGMWANYILNKERNHTLTVVNKARLLKEGKYYHVKSLKKGLDVKVLIAYCKSREICAIAPSSVSDEIYCSTHLKTLNANGIYPFCCEDPQSYITLDHKWLAYQFCEENGIPQAETLPLRVDTADACRALVAKTVADGKPCFVKECFDTCAGDGVIKVDKVEDYEAAVMRITGGRGPQPADTVGAEQHIIVQAGHPGRISCCHNIFYKGNMVSCYVTKENEAIMDKLGDLRLDMAVGTWSQYDGELATSFKLDLDDPCDRNIRDQAVDTMKKVGKALNYTGMLEVEFIVAHAADAAVNILEFNPRFSGACHSYVGAGMVQDYMNVLALIATTGDDTDKVMKVAGTTHVRSDTHIPKSNFKDYNAVKFYLPQPGTILKLRVLR